MVKVIALLSALFLGSLAFGANPAMACDKAAGSTECLPPPDINYNGTGTAKPTLKPEACVTAEAYDMMTGPGVEFWFTYYLRYPNGSAEDMEPIVRNKCVKKQWVTPGTKIGFWVDCYGYRWWFETAAITKNGRYTMELVKKMKL